MPHANSWCCVVLHVWCVLRGAPVRALSAVERDAEHSAIVSGVALAVGSCGVGCRLM